MRIVNRKMESKITDSAKTIGLSHQSQASINSDGQICIRNYQIFQNADKDEIIVLDKEETEAIIKLIKVITKLPNDLPF